MNYPVCSRFTKGLSSGLFVITLTAGVYSLSDSVSPVFADSGKGESEKTEKSAAEKATAAAQIGNTKENEPDSRPLRVAGLPQPADKAGQSLALGGASLAPPDESADEFFQDFHATAYCLKGRTAMGTAAETGMIAADPSVLPLGTLVHIKAGPYTGTYKVQDTGYHIKGNRVDIYVANHAEAVRFGRRQVKLRVVNRVRRVHKRG